MRHKKHKKKNHQVSLNLESIYVHEEREEGVFFLSKSDAKNHAKR